MKSSLRLLTIALAWAVAALAVAQPAAPSRSATEIDRVIAVVNTDVITELELAARLQLSAPEVLDLSGTNQGLRIMQWASRCRPPTSCVARCWSA